MALTASNLTANGSAAASSFTTASITPSANGLVLALFQQRLASGATITIPTATGNNLTWVQIATIEYDDLNAPAGRTKRMTLFRAMGASPTTGAITFDLAGQSQSHAAWSVDQWSGMDTSGTNGSGAIVQSVTSFNDTGTSTSLTVTLAAFSSVNNGTYGAFANSVGGAGGLTAGGSFTLLGDGQTAGGNALTEYSLSNVTSVNATTAASEIGGIALEIKVAASSTQFVSNLSTLGVG